MRLRVALVDTAPDPHGSMVRYGDLVVEALEARAAAGIASTRLRLTLPPKVAAAFPGRLRTWAHHAWLRLAAPARLGRLDADVVHILDGSRAYVARWVTDGRVIVTIHDLIPLLQSLGRLGERTPSRLARRLIGANVRSLRQAAGLVSDSRHTAEDVQRHADVPPSRITVVPPALSPRLTGLEPPPDRGTAELPYVLHVGHGAFYKNRPGVLRVFARLRARRQLRLKFAGAPPEAELRALAARLGIADTVEFVVDPDDVRLVALYRSASLLLFPSLYEGFGWPPLEAMALGCPVVCSTAASLPEVVGEAALSCPAEDEEGLASRALQVLERPELTRQLVERGRSRAARYSVEAMGHGLLEVYRAVADNAA